MLPSSLNEWELHKWQRLWVSSNTKFFSLECLSLNDANKTPIQHLIDANIAANRPWFVHLHNIFISNAFLINNVKNQVSYFAVRPHIRYMISNINFKTLNFWAKSLTDCLLIALNVLRMNKIMRPLKWFMIKKTHDSNWMELHDLLKTNYYEFI